MKKRWSPLRCFKGVIVSEERVLTLEEELEREAWAEWGRREEAEFEVVPGLPYTPYRPTARWTTDQLSTRFLRALKQFGWKF